MFRFHCVGDQFWDNNEGRNYRFVCANQQEEEGGAEAGDNADEAKKKQEDSAEAKGAAKDQDGGGGRGSRARYRVYVSSHK